MEFKADALLLRSTDYGENDKIVTLLTAERGKLSAGIKGVKKAGAKLKFAAQPFCFAEYVLAARGGRNTVISASLHDGFYALREDICAYYAAACVTELCDRVLFEGMEGGGLLIAAVQALRSFCEGNTEDALVSFLLTAAAEAGYPVHAEECPVCGKPLFGRMAFDMNSGCFTCAGCSDGVPASESTYRAIRAAYAGESVEGDGNIRALRLLRAYFLHQTDLDLPPLEEYLRLIVG